MRVPPTRVNSVIKYPAFSTFKSSLILQHRARHPKLDNLKADPEGSTSTHTNLLFNMAEREQFFKMITLRYSKEKVGVCGYRPLEIRFQVAPVWDGVFDVGESGAS